MKNVRKRILSLFLCLAFIAGMVFIPVPFVAKAETATTNFAGTLGDEWSVGWNGSDIPADEFVKISSANKKVGVYSLRIGHPQEKTQLTIKLQIPVDTVQAYQYSLYAMATGTVDAVDLYVRDGAEGKGDGNILGYNIKDKLTSSWTLIQNSDNATEEDADGSATELTVDSGVFCLDIGVTCPAGSYVYFDNIDVFATSAKTYQLNRDASFERWYGDSNVSNYNIEDFITISTEQASAGTHSMRIGNDTVDTNIVLKRYIPTVKGRTLNYNYFDFDYYVQLPEGVDTATAVVSDYITTASVMMKGYSPSTSTQNKATSNIAATTTLGAWVTDTGKSNVAWVGSDAKTYLYVEITVNMKAGTFIYLDNVLAGNCGYEKKTPTPDMMFNGSFEQGIEEKPISDVVVAEDLPHGWHISWNANNKLRHHYVTKNAYEGQKALFVSARDNATAGHTIAQDLSGLTAGETYVFEAYVRKGGDFVSARFFRNDHNANVSGGASNTSMVSDFPDSTYSNWTKLSGTFKPTDSDTTISIYMNANRGSWMAVDNVAVYKQSDESNTNIVVNGGFEAYVPPKELDYFEGTLGNEWSCLENRNTAIDYTKFVDVTKHQAYAGNYAMRVGYAYADTDITLRYKKTVENGEYTYSAYLNATDTPLTGSKISLKDGENGTPIETTLTDLTSAWTQYTGTVTVTGGEIVIDFNISLKAGKYLYIDFMNLVNTSAPGNPLNADGSFERFVVTSNKGAAGYEDSDFVTIVDTKAADGKKSLRIGNANTATDLVVEYVVPMYPTRTGRSDTFRLLTSVYFEGDTANSTSYIRYGDLSGKNWRQYNISSVASNEWTNLTNSVQCGTDGKTVTTGGPYIYSSNFFQIRLVVKCNAGEYLYIDNINVYNNNFKSNNLFADASFENYDLKQTVFTTDTSLTSALTVPSNWSVSWNSNQSYRYHYRSNEAHSGDYALALKAYEKKMGHTFKQSLSSKVEVGAEYTVEGYFKKVGTFSAISLMETASGASNNTFKQLKDVTMNEYTFVSATFTARAGSGFNLYTVSAIDSLLLVDDLKIYKSDDETKTNILTNGDFENWKSSNKEQYRIKKTFANAPSKFEATVKLPVDFADGEIAGVILGNYNGKDESINLEVSTNGNPRVYIRDAENKSYDLIFNDIDLRTGKWTQISVVKNTATIDLYINGELSASKDFTATLNTAATPYAISGDNITVEKRYSFSYDPDNEITNPNYFKGEIKNVAFYDNANKLIASYNLSHTLDPEIIVDETNNGYYAIRYGNFIKELQAEDDDATAWPYSFIAIGDTQYVCERDKKKGTNDMTYIYDWIVANKDTKNVKFVMGLGDITDENTVEEYAVAAKHLQKLNDAGIPQSIIRGNHDGPNQKVMDLYDECLRDVIAATPYDGIMTAPVFDENGELVSGTYDNMYYTVEVGEQKWLIFALGYQPNSEILAWAGDIIEQHSDYSVILTTHGYINGKLEITNSARQKLWDELGCKYSNIRLILCGDCNDVDIAMQKRVGINGNVVTEMLIDRQVIDQSIAYGHVTLLRFSEDGTKVKVEDYASVKEKYFRPANQFVLDINPDATANDAAIFNFEDYLDRKALYDNKDLEMQDLLSGLKANIMSAEGIEAVNTAYNVAVEAVTAPAAPTITITGTTATLTATDGYEYSLDSKVWQDSPIFAELSLDTKYSFYQRKSAKTTGFASISSAPADGIIVSAPTALVGSESIYVKPIDGYEYSLDNTNWQDSPVFNIGIINGENYVVYQRPKNADNLIIAYETEYTEVTINGQEKAENPTAYDMLRIRNKILDDGYSIDVSMDHNGDYTIDARDVVSLKKFLASIDAA